MDLSWRRSSHRCPNNGSHSTTDCTVHIVPIYRSWKWYWIWISLWLTCSTSIIHPWTMDGIDKVPQTIPTIKERRTKETDKTRMIGKKSFERETCKGGMKSVSRPTIDAQRPKRRQIYPLPNYSGVLISISIYSTEYTGYITGWSWCFLFPLSLGQVLDEILFMVHPMARWSGIDERMQSGNGMVARPFRRRHYPSRFGDDQGKRWSFDTGLIT